MRRADMRFIAPVGVIAAGALFWYLSHGGVVSSMSIHGYAEAEDHPAASLQAGRLETVRVRLGQQVRAGEILATMATRDLALKLRIAEIGLSQATAQLPAQDIQARAASARAELLVVKTQSTQNRDRAELTEVDQQLDRLDKLAAEQLVPAQVIEQERLRKANLSANLAVLDAATKEHQAGLGHGALKERTTEQQVALRLEPYREAVRLKKEAVEAARIALDEATIRAPVEGTVSLIVHHPGDVVPAATEVVRVASGRPGYVICWVPERMAGEIALGRPTRIRGFGLLAGGWGGRVVEISPELEEVPPRARVSPNVPAWGRRVAIESAPRQPLLLGEAVYVRF